MNHKNRLEKEKLFRFCSSEQLAFLTPREEEIVRLAFGIGRATKSISELAHLFGFKHRQSILGIISKAQIKLQATLNKRKPYLLFVKDIQKILGGISRGKVHFLVQHGLIVSFENEHKELWRQYSPVDAVTFLVVNELIKNGIPLEKVKLIVNGVYNKRPLISLLNPDTENTSRKQDLLIDQTDGLSWTVHECNLNSEWIIPKGNNAQRRQLFNRWSNHIISSLILIDLLALKSRIRVYLDKKYEFERRYDKLVRCRKCVKDTGA